MSTRKTHGFFQVADPVGKAAHLMAHRNDMPIAARMHAKKRSSLRVKRPLSDNWTTPPSMPKDYRNRITLARVWEPKP